MNTEKVKVWDIFIRLFHWALVVLFVTAYITEGEHNLHFYAGWLIVLLIVLRIFWGFFGSQYARFSDFIKRPGEIMDYVRTLRSSAKPTRFPGHNPLGGLMILAMLICLSGTVVTGVLLYQEEHTSTFEFVQQPLWQGEEDDDSDHHEREQTAGKYEEQKSVIKTEANHWEESDYEEFLEEAHEILVNLMLLLILLHLAGVLFSSMKQKENLVRAMFSGWKNAE